MEARPHKIGEVLKDQRRFIVPIYQRTYAWRETPHLERFFGQVEAKANERLNGTVRFPHYMGAALIIPRPYVFGQMEVVDIVDGQQRLITFQIFIAVLRDLARSMGNEGAASLLAGYVLNPDDPRIRADYERYKLYPTAYDRHLYFDLVRLDFEALRKKYAAAFDKSGRVNSTAQLPLRAWCYLRKQAETFINMTNGSTAESRLGALSSALLEDLQVIVITLGEQDDAQVIFETLNVGGEPLAAMDLVRNDTFHRATQGKEDVEALMESRWKTFEDPFWKQPGTRGRIKKPRIDFFLNDVLAAESDGDVLLTELYARYKKFVAEKNFKTVDLELESLLKHVPTFHMLIDPVGEQPLAQLARDLQIFDVTTAYPLVFAIQASEEPEHEKSALYRLISSYIVRRMLCGLTTQKYNNTFVKIARKLQSAGVSLENGRGEFSSLTGDTVRFPDDLEFRLAIQKRKQYGNILQIRLRYILAQLELRSRDKFSETTSIPNDLSIEHIMPDAWMQHWCLPDGTQAAADLVTGMTESQLKYIKEREALKHTLGNLTILTDALNPSLSNLGFEEKRIKLASSLLKLNREIAELPDWTEERIRARAERLSDLAVDLWPSASLPLAVPTADL